MQDNDTEFVNENESLFTDESLKGIPYTAPLDPNRPAEPPPPNAVAVARSIKIPDPGLPVLGLGSEPLRLNSISSGGSPGGDADAGSDGVMSAPVDGAESDDAPTHIRPDSAPIDILPDRPPEHSPPRDHRNNLEQTAQRVMEETEKNQHDVRSRDVAGGASGFERASVSPTDPRPGKTLPLRVDPPSVTSIAHILTPSEDTMAKSPVLARLIQTREDGDGDTLPAVHATSPIKEEGPSSPQQQLPSIRQLTDSLPELAQAATTRARSSSHPFRPHSQSFSSTTSPPSVHPSFPYPTANQVSQYGTARSPIAMIGDNSMTYQSPTNFAFPAMFSRRASAAIDYDAYANSMHPRHSTSSASDSHGTSTDGISTAHTTPIESGPSPDATARLTLPPPPGMQPLSYKCDHPNCTAPPFQTPYLLSSHKNVHSQCRPHYCSVEGCPRSKEGKGFKRKNEMIRHGLVHDSPGFICPFCPERDHRYPRPDNLQRHVRVHHTDKERDHPDLLKVLNQRIAGASGKQRRRRTQTGPLDTANPPSSSSAPAAAAAATHTHVPVPAPPPSGDAAK